MKPHALDTDQIAQDYAWLWLRAADDSSVFPVRATVKLGKVLFVECNEGMLKRLEAAGLVKIVGRKGDGFEIEIYHMSKRNVGAGLIHDNNGGNK